jgi:hypothetical protein
VSVSVDAPLSPGKSRQIAESTIRPVTGVAGAPLPHHQPQFRSRSGRLHPHQATRGSTVTPGLDVNTEGNCIRERDCVAYGNLASDGTAHGATTSALAKCEKSRKYREVSLAPLAGDYARPAAWPYRSRKPPRPATYRHRSVTLAVINSTHSAEIMCHALLSRCRSNIVCKSVPNAARQTRCGI